jgi:hypothetical protein
MMILTDRRITDELPAPLACFIKEQVLPVNSDDFAFSISYHYGEWYDYAALLPADVDPRAIEEVVRETGSRAKAAHSFLRDVILTGAKH